MLVIGTALPLPSGSPRQRLAHALRTAIAEQAGGQIAITHLTVEAWTAEAGGSQWTGRARMRAGDRLLPAALGRARLAPGPISDLRPDPLQRQGPAQQSDWMSPRRRRRIVALARAVSADLVLLTDPLLADLALDLHALGKPVLLWDDGMADWATAAASVVRDGMTSQSLRQTGTALAQARDHWAPLLRLVLSGRDLAIPIPPNPLFFHKAHSLVVPATGLTGCDRMTLDWVAQFYDRLQARGAAPTELPQLTLTGFAPHLLAGLRARWPAHQPAPDLQPDLLAALQADLQPDWDKLHTAVGAARCLFIPFAPPALAALALGALAVGTPVLTLAAGHPGQGWPQRHGVFADHSAGLPLVLAQLLDPALLGPVQYRRIAAAAAAAPGAEGVPQLLTHCGIQTGIGSDLQPEVQPQPALQPALQLRPRRIPPVAGRPRVLYTQATGMLLLRLTLRRSAQIDEVRLLDGTGAELNRLAPPVATGPLIAMEGGVVIERAALARTLGAALRIELHDSFGPVAALSVPVAEFDLIDAEMAMVQVEDTVLRGAFWAMDSPVARAWAISFGAVAGTGQSAGTSRVSPGGAVPMPEVGALAIPFVVPLPLATDLVDCTIWGSDTPVGSASAGPASTGPAPLHRGQQFAPLLQRPYHDAAQGHGAGAGAGRRNAVSAGARAAIRALQGKHAGQRAWIIGNGPSVRLDDLARIPAGDVIFCFNRFYLSYADSPLREDYVVSADTLMVRDFGAEMIERSTGLPLFCLPAERMMHLQDDFSGQYAGRFIHLPPGDFYLPVFSLDPGDFVTVGGSSVYVALQMAHYMGLRDLVLYGMDYSFSVKMQRDPRFPFPVSFEEGNHFITSYRGAKPWCPPTWRDISAGFLNARVAFDLSGGRIVNATRGGRLETFARVDFDRLI